MTVRRRPTRTWRPRRLHALPGRHERRAVGRLVRPRVRLRSPATRRHRRRAHGACTARRRRARSTSTADARRQRRASRAYNVHRSTAPTLGARGHRSRSRPRSSWDTTTTPSRHLLRSLRSRGRGRQRRESAVERGDASSNGGPPPGSWPRGASTPAAARRRPTNQATATTARSRTQPGRRRGKVRQGALLQRHQRFGQRPRLELARPDDRDDDRGVGQADSARNDWRTLVVKERPGDSSTASTRTRTRTRPQSQVTIGGVAAAPERHGAVPAGHVDASRGDLRRRDPAALRQRHPGRHARRRGTIATSHRAAQDRRQRDLGRVVQRPDRRGPRLQPRAHAHRDPGGHERRDHNRRLRLLPPRLVHSLRPAGSARSPCLGGRDRQRWRRPLQRAPLHDMPGSCLSVANRIAQPTAPSYVDTAWRRAPTTTRSPPRTQPATSARLNEAGDGLG